MQFWITAVRISLLRRRRTAQQKRGEENQPPKTEMPYVSRHRLSFLSTSASSKWNTYRRQDRLILSVNLVVCAQLGAFSLQSRTA